MSALQPPAPAEPSGPIAWIGSQGPDGNWEESRWGSPDALGLPLSDRGLLLAFGLFETVLVERDRPRLLAQHLQRLASSAALLELPPPPGPAVVEPLVAEAIARSGITTGALRLNWSCGSPTDPASRGLDPAATCRPRFWLQLSPSAPSFAPVRVIVSATEVRSATSLLSRCKTFAYGASLVARRQAAAAGAHDALLASSAGGLCCGSAANLLVRRGNHWFTPPLASGCLPGVMRARALALGLVAEAALGELDEAEVLDGAGAMLLNSLGCRPISHLDQHALRWGGGSAQQPAEQAEHFWSQLLPP
jgi:branched-subunit amino acid aminotransferase/4-amino-4-deoxychorismate lyase